jgi:hypothetical protein
VTHLLRSVLCVLGAARNNAVHCVEFVVSPGGMPLFVDRRLGLGCEYQQSACSGQGAHRSVLWAGDAP